jgi:hypothetical protein
MGFRTMEQQQAAINAAQLEQERRKTIELVYGKHQQMIRCLANERLIIEVIERFAGEVVPSFGIFEDAILENPDEMKNFATQAVEKSKEQITEDILSLLSSKDGGRDGKFNDFNLQSEKSRMASWSLEALRVRLAEIKTKQHMATTPVSVLKAFVSDAHADKRKYPGFPELPKQIWNGTDHVAVNASFFRRLDAHEVRRYTRLYSVEQVNDRIKETA